MNLTIYKIKTTTTKAPSTQRRLLNANFFMRLGLPSTRRRWKTHKFENALQRKRYVNGDRFRVDGDKNMCLLAFAFTIVFVWTGPYTLVKYDYMIMIMIMIMIIHE